MSVTVATEEVASLYQALKQYTPEVRKDRRLQVPPADSVTVHAPLCASQVTLDALFEGDHVVEIGYRVRACSLGQATTAILARRAPGLEAATLARVHDQLRAILDGSTTTCDWPELEVFALTREIPGRRGSAELPFKALAQLFRRAGLSGVPPDKEVSSSTQPAGSDA